MKGLRFKGIVVSVALCCVAFVGSAAERQNKPAAKPIYSAAGCMACHQSAATDTHKSLKKIG